MNDTASPPSSTLWVFGFGSLIWKPDFPDPPADARDCYTRGWVRRFWQASTDHRGTPEAPGRVLTLVQAGADESTALCRGRAYGFRSAQVQAVLAYLDVREQDGYVRRYIPIWDAQDDTLITAHALVYVADEHSERFVKDEQQRRLECIAAVIATARGPSGDNVTYVLRLQQALREMQVTDAHIEQVIERLRHAHHLARYDSHFSA